jgi:hypothetical protein
LRGIYVLKGRICMGSGYSGSNRVRGVSSIYWIHALFS